MVSKAKQLQNELPVEHRHGSQAYVNHVDKYYNEIKRKRKQERKNKKQARKRNRK